MKSLTHPHRTTGNVPGNCDAGVKMHDVSGNLHMYYEKMHSVVLLINKICFQCKHWPREVFL